VNGTGSLQRVRVSAHTSTTRDLPSFDRCRTLMVVYWPWRLPFIANPHERRRGSQSHIAARLGTTGLDTKLNFRGR
jgi:hypothetical protein